MLIDSTISVAIELMYTDFNLWKFKLCLNGLRNYYKREGAIEIHKDSPIPHELLLFLILFFIFLPTPTLATIEIERGQSRVASKASTAACGQISSTCTYSLRKLSRVLKSDNRDRPERLSRGAIAEVVCPPPFWWWMQGSCTVTLLLLQAPQEWQLV